jgi:hypothetical protein
MLAKVAQAGEQHGEACVIGGGDHLVVAQRSAGLITARAPASAIPAAPVAPKNTGSCCEQSARAPRLVYLRAGWHRRYWWESSSP